MQVDSDIWKSTWEKFEVILNSPISTSPCGSPHIVICMWDIWMSGDSHPILRLLYRYIFVKYWAPATWVLSLNSRPQWRLSHPPMSRCVLGHSSVDGQLVAKCWQPIKSLRTVVWPWVTCQSQLLSILSPTWFDILHYNSQWISKARISSKVGQSVPVDPT